MFTESAIMNIKKIFKEESIEILRYLGLVSNLDWKIQIKQEII